MTLSLFTSQANVFSIGGGGLDLFYLKRLGNLTLALLLVSTTNETTAGVSASFPSSNGSKQVYSKDPLNLTAVPALVSTVAGVAGSGDRSNTIVIKDLN